MRPITLLLTTPNGEEIGQLPIAKVAVADAGESSSTQSAPLNEAMDTLHQHIHQAVRSEGLVVALDPIDFEITVGRALMSGTAQEPVLIRLPVRDEKGSPANTAGSLPPASDPMDQLFRDLFNLDSSTGGKHHA